MNIKSIESDSKFWADDIKKMNRPILNGKAEDLSNYTFWQYTRVDSICKILNGDCFWINNISGMNDKREANLHRSEKNDIFIQCFCNVNTERIPMWYLYGGIVGRGGSIGLTPGVMLNYINSINYVTELVQTIDGKIIPGERYEIGKDFEMQSGWVFYTDHTTIDNKSNYLTNPNNIIHVNYRNKSLKVINVAEFYSNNYFIKDLPWEYEKEFRLVFINKTGKEIQRIKIDIPDEFRIRKDRKLKVTLAPEINTDIEFEKYKKMILDNGKKYNIQVLKSKLEINMDLLERNKNDINNHVQNNPMYLREDVQKSIYNYYKYNKK